MEEIRIEWAKKGHVLMGFFPWAKENISDIESLSEKDFLDVKKCINYFFVKARTQRNATLTPEMKQRINVRIAIVWNVYEKYHKMISYIFQNDEMPDSLMETISMIEGVENVQATLHYFEKGLIVDTKLSDGKSTIESNNSSSISPFEEHRLTAYALDEIIKRDFDLKEWIEMTVQLEHMYQIRIDQLNNYKYSYSQKN